MSQATRHYSGMVTILSVGGEDILAMFKDVTYFEETDTQEARAAQDNWEWPVGRISRWGIDLSKVVDDEGDDLYVMLAGAAVAIIFESASTDGINVTGNALLTRIELRIPDSDGQENSLTLRGVGQPTVVTST